MGLSCEIIVFKAAECKPGDEINGGVKYTVDEETVFKRIILSLKGTGHLRIRDHSKNLSPVFVSKESYVDIDLQRHDKEIIGPGCHEFKFKFLLPDHIPPSFAYKSNTEDYSINCRINYYLRVKFEKCGVLKLAKKFKKEIYVKSAIIPTLPTQPTYYGNNYKLMSLSSKNNTIVVKSCMLTPVVNDGKVKFCYEILNNSNVKLRGVKVRIKEILTFKAKGLKRVKRSKDIEEGKSKSGAVNCGGNQNMDFEVNLPSDLSNIQHSVIVARDYRVVIKLLLPKFRMDRVLEMPFQIDNTVESRVMFDDLPTYSEAISPERKSEQLTKGSFDGHGS